MENTDKRSTVDMFSNSPLIPDQEGNKAPQYIFTFAATMAAFCAGTGLAWTGPALLVLQESDNTTYDEDPTMFLITSDEGSWVSSMLPLGALVGALPTGYLANIFGRKLVCAALSIPFAVSWLMITLASSVWTLYAARFIMGLATGGACTIAPMYVSEIAEKSVRGSLGSCFQLLMSLGILYTYTFGAIVSYHTLAICCGLAPVAFLLMIFAAPESPVYLLKKNQHKEAESSLRRLRGPLYNVTNELNDLQRDIDANSSTEGSFSDIFKSKASFRGLIVALGLMFFQQMSGVNAVIFYANSIFKDAGSTMSPSISSIIVGLVQVVVTYCSVLLVDRAGRRILLLISAAVMAICQGLLALYFFLKESGQDVSDLAFLPLGSVVFYIVLFSLGFGPIPWMMTGELFTSNLKGPATGLAVGLTWTLAFLITKMFSPLSQALGTGFTFGIFGVMCGLAVIFVALLVPETKGRSIDEIQNLLAGIKNRLR